MTETPTARTDLVDFALQTKRIASCVPFPLAKGTTKVVDLAARQSVTGVEQRYAISAADDKEYRVELNLAFTTGPLGIKDNKLTLSKTQEVQKCLDEINPFIKGPKGEKLSFHLGTSAPSVSIEIGPPKYRSHSRKWAGDADCSTIFHELLHLVGLVDEYIDTTDNNNSYNCRIEGSPYSIMNIHGNTYADAKEGLLPSVLLPHHFYSILAADCIEGESAYARCARRAYSNAQQSDKCLAGKKIVAECQKLFIPDYTNEFRKLFLASNKTLTVIKLATLIADTANVPDGVSFFLDVLENAESYSEDHADYSIIAIHKLLQRGSVVNPISDRILAALIKRVKKKAIYWDRVKDVLLMLLKGRDIDTQKQFVKNATDISETLATYLQEGLGI